MLAPLEDSTMVPFRTRRGGKTVGHSWISIVGMCGGHGDRKRVSHGGGGGRSQ